MKYILINGSNVDANTYNSSYTLQFNGNKQFSNHQLAVVGVNIYNSSFNITAFYGNNVISIKWCDGNTYSLTLSDGYYGVNDLNTALQKFMVLNNLYLITSSFQNVYFVEILPNAVNYNIEINLYTIPTSSQASTLSYTQPAGSSWSYPVSAITPQIQFLSQNFGNLIGFTAGIYPSTPQTSTTSLLSSFVPEITPVMTYLMSSNMVSSDIMQISSLFYSIPINAGWGSLIVSQPPQLVWIDIIPSIYSFINIQLYDQNFNKLRLQDYDCTFTLAIKDKNEH